ncbi:MAG: hypothetical protein AAFP02_03315 [Bacteroidota bacterium]
MNFAAFLAVFAIGTVNAIVSISTIVASVDLSGPIRSFAAIAAGNVDFEKTFGFGNGNGLVFDGDRKWPRLWWVVSGWDFRYSSSRWFWIT